jgi:hypothetical protein
VDCEWPVGLFVDFLSILSVVLFVQFGDVIQIVQVGRVDFSLIVLRIEPSVPLLPVER